MNGLKLVIGSRWASSWSLRPWLLLKQSGLPFQEIVIQLRQPDTSRQIRSYSPSGKVPVLIVDGMRIWDSLAIAEYLAERQPGLWPEDRAARALARAVSCEMHSGFAALRTFLPMDFNARFDPPGRLLAPVERDIERIVEIWADCRRAATVAGPFLFGAFSIADAMFAPVCSRFATYAVPLDGDSAGYVRYMMALPALREWGRLAQAELGASEAPALATPTAPLPRELPPPLPDAAAPVSLPEPEPAEPRRAIPFPAAEEEPPPGPRPIPSTIMVKPIGDGTRRRR